MDKQYNIAVVGTGDVDIIGTTKEKIDFIKVLSSR